jgi:hypothetical protein
MCRQHQSLSRNACLSTISRSYFSVDEDRQKVQPSIRLRAYQDLPNPFRCATVNPRTPTSGNSREHETDEQVRNVNNKSHFDPLYRFLIRSGSRSRRSCPKSRVSKITRHQLMNSTTHCHSPVIRGSTTKFTHNFGVSMPRLVLPIKIATCSTRMTGGVDGSHTSQRRIFVNRSISSLRAF